MRVFAAIATLICASLLSCGAWAGETPYTGPGSNITTGTGLYYCFGAINVMGQDPVKNYFYVTGAFPVPNAQTQQLQTQWRDYVQSQHPGQLVALANCSQAQTDPAKQVANEQSWIDQWKNKATIIRTTWKYGQGAANAATTTVAQQPAPPSSGDANGQEYFCTFDDQTAFDQRSGKGTIVRYLSHPFSSTKFMSQLQNDWNIYVRATYHEPNTISGWCMLNQERYGSTKQTSETNKNMKLINIEWHP